MTTNLILALNLILSLFIFVLTWALDANFRRRTYQLERRILDIANNYMRIHTKQGKLESQFHVLNMHLMGPNPTPKVKSPVDIPLAASKNQDEGGFMESAMREALNLKYEAVGTSASDQAMGATGKAGDVFVRLIVTVSTAGANGTCSIKDGSGSAIPIVAASTPIGVYVIDLGMRSTAGAWSVTTGSDATAIGIGQFS